MKKNIFVLLTILISNYGLPQLPRLKVSENKHFLVSSEGKPFFWLGDTGWELFHRLTSGDAERYMKKRAGQGFTVIQAVVLAELDGLRSPNANGDIPLRNNDPTQPNEAYFKFVDTLLNLAAKNNIYIALLPTWGDKVFKNSWGTGPEIFTDENAYLYGKWIGNRYKDQTNIIWVIGGDRSPGPGLKDVSIWRSMANGIMEGVGGRDRAIMTFHPQPDGSSSSSQWFQQDEWLSLNMLQTGHCRDSPVWEMIKDDYSRYPTKPVLNGESIYEEMPVCFNAKELGYASAYDVRKSAYLSVFAGACGHTYGAGPVIWFSEKTNHLFAVFHTWREALDLTGANEMKYLRMLIESRPMLERVPDQGLLVDSETCASERVEATRGQNYAFFYSAYGRSINIVSGRIKGEKLVANWFDPRTGESLYIGIFENKGKLIFTPPLPKASPVPSQKEDWVLILDNAEMSYRVPGNG
jgi:hypothetical protein